MRAACGLPPDEEVVAADSVEEKKKVIAELMDLKAKRGQGAAAALAAVQEVASQQQEASDDDEEEPSIPIFDLPPGISIISFNIRKLRNMTSGTPAMWQQLMAEMATHDVIMLTEVPASEKLYQDRVGWFEQTLNILSRTPNDDAPWTHVASEYVECRVLCALGRRRAWRHQCRRLQGQTQRRWPWQQRSSRVLCEKAN